MQRVMRPRPRATREGEDHHEDGEDRRADEVVRAHLTSLCCPAPQLAVFTTGEAEFSVVVPLAVPALEDVADVAE